MHGPINVKYWAASFRPIFVPGEYEWDINVGFSLEQKTVGGDLFCVWFMFIL